MIQSDIMILFFVIFDKNGGTTQVPPFFCC